MTAFSEMTINERIEYLIKDLGMNANSFAVKIGAADTLVRNIINNKSKPSYDTITKIIKTYSTCSDWLLFGDGEIYKHSSLETNQETPIEELIEELELYKKREKMYLEMLDKK
jgi:plasmid maintenance system antidote protein VapI